MKVGQLTLVSSSQRDSKLSGGALLGRGKALILIAVCCVSAGCHKIEAAYCDARLPAARFQVDGAAPAYLVSTAASARDLGDQRGRDGEMITYGLTSAHSSVLAEASLHVIGLPGAVCARPDLSVHMAYKPMTVQIARELAPNTCAYETVLGHEKKHVDAFAQQLAKSSAALSSEIRARGLEHARVYSNVEAAERDLQHLQDDWLVPRGEELLANVENAQRAVDSPEEYRRVGSACPDSPWLAGSGAPGGFHF